MKKDANTRNAGEPERRPAAQAMPQAPHANANSRAR